MADTRVSLRTHLFTELIPLPPERWPEDGADLFALGLDSIGVLRLVAFVEQELGYRIPEDEIVPEKLGSVSALLVTIGG